MTSDVRNSLRPWDAFIAPKEKISLSDAAGRIAASTIRQYPPGIPDIIPGTVYSSQTIVSLENAHAANVDVIGLDGVGNPKVDVVIQATKTSDALDIQVFEAHTISDHVANEIADFFGLSFSGAPYFHFAFHESDPLQSLPHTLDFEAYAVSVALSNPEDRKTCQDALRGIAFEKARHEIAMPELGEMYLPKGFHFWTDKDLCRKHIKDRLTDPGYVTLVRDVESGKLKGLLHSRMATIKRLFYTEEWSNPLLFSAYNNKGETADPEDYFRKIDYHFGLKPDALVMTISAQVLSPDIQGGDVFYDMMKLMALHVKPEHTRLPILCEIPPHGTAHSLNKAFTHRIIFGVLQNAHPLVFSAQTSQALFPFIHRKRHWFSLLRKAAHENVEYGRKYYISQRTDHDSVIVRRNGKLGLAVFATKNIAAGTRIAVFTGEKYTAKTALGLPAIMRDHAIQIGPEEFVFGYKGLAHRLCHSCNPNCGIRELTEIFSIRDITQGEQLTWDYRCSENSNWVLEECLCGAERCTGTVTNFDSLPVDMKSEYLSKFMVSEWISSTRVTQD